MPEDKLSGHRPGANAHGLGPDTAPTTPAADMHQAGEQHIERLPSRSIVLKSDNPHPDRPTAVVDAKARVVIEPLLQFFEFGHLPEKQRDTAREFYTLAHDLVAVLPRNPERTVALRKLLEAKDCAVRAMVFKS